MFDSINIKFKVLQDSSFILVGDKYIVKEFDTECAF